MVYIEMKKIRHLYNKLATAIVTECGSRDGVCALGAEYDEELENKQTNNQSLGLGEMNLVSWVGERWGQLGEGIPGKAQHCDVGLI